MKEKNLCQLLKGNLSKSLYINSSNIFLFWKGRVALYAILKAIGVNREDEVILPAFTCVVAVNPIIYLGAKPVYVDIDPKTYNIDINRIEEKITKKTKVILAQNTFGLAPDLGKIFEIANKYELMVIEDCAHGFGGFYKGNPNGTIADASFFSTQWNKPFSTGLGGIAVTKNSEIAEKLKKMEETFIKPSLKNEIILKSLLLVREKLNPNLYWVTIKTYRWLSKNNLILGSSQGKELEKPVMPKNFKKGFSKTQAEKGIERLKKFNNILIHRRKIANFYKQMLLDIGIEPPYEPNYAIHTYLKFPLLVKDRDKFFAEAMKRRIEFGDWFLSPIHPITRNLGYWQYKWGEDPIGERISQHIVNLPTHLRINGNYVERIREFMKRNRGNIYDSVKECLGTL